MARIAKKVLSGTTGQWIRCAWFECDRDGVELHKARFHEHARTMSCAHPLSKHVHFIFCSERHRQYYLHSHRDMWNLPPGYANSL